LVARERLILVLPPKGEEVHPIWQMIEAVVDGVVVQSLEPTLTQAADLTAPVEHRNLPQRRRWWQLPHDVRVPLRPKESFSSLELMLFSPYRWLLQYPARLRPSRIVSLGSEFRMLGNLAHDLVDALYQRPDALQMPAAVFDAWFSREFDQRVAEEGALLRMPGRGSDLESFRYRLREAVASLRGQLARAGINEVTPEMELSGLFAGGELTGFADLVVRKSDSEWGIVDMKWSGAKKFPEKLKANSHLQLAIYAQLFRQGKGGWPSVAYFILDRARLFAPDPHFFPGAEAVPAKSGENTAQLWLRFIESWKWRKSQIEAGQIEVAAEDIAPTPESAPPAEAMAPEYLGDAYNDYWALAGWDD
jgi:RecB family exonuclease